MSEKCYSAIKIQVITICLLMFAFIISGCRNVQKNENHMQFASSPYLREHADNPVEWMEWGDEALKKAEKENKPLIISIGYAACHWCHVMEEESFMDTAVARVMNENFICIKVDREERPDIDKIYMDALQHLSGNSGWPLNAFALPDGKPFFAGTYYPKNDWLGLLQNVIHTYRTKNKLVVMQAQALHNGMNSDNLKLADTTTKQQNLLASNYPALYDSIIKAADTINGGLTGEPKFPTPAFSEMLLQHYYTTGNKQAKDIALHTLDAMSLSAMYDQVGGGFARYATDSKWRVPHFEKMLYDNALMISLYAHAYRLTKNEDYKIIIGETIDFIESRLAVAEGGYFSSVNADTKEGEGKFYAWNKKDFLAASHNDSLLLAYYNITSPGNWIQEDNIPYATQTAKDFALENKISPGQFAGQLQLAKKSLLKARNKRAMPSVDTKIVTAWNSMMIKAYADAYAATGIEDYLVKARKGASFIEKKLSSADGSLPRILSASAKKIPGFLDDYAWTASAFIRLYEVSFEIRWLNGAQKLTDYVIKNFYHPSSNLFFYTSSSANLFMRKIAIADDDLPSPNAVMAEVLYRLGNFYQDTLYSHLSLGMCSAVITRVKTSPRYHMQWCKLLGLLSAKGYEVTILGEAAVQKNKVMQQHYLPTSIFMGSTEAENLPLLKNKLVAGKTFIYVCTERMCKRPVSEPDSAIYQIKNRPAIPL